MSEEINILETNIQIVIQKKNIDDLSITEYASKYYIYKRITYCYTRINNPQLVHPITTLTSSVVNH